ncbi:MAG: nucleotide exchange factor GrpE [Bacilli bacterium]|nr:nucleotide exchange factor GrpE [Bacilli bacterium]
MTMAKEEAAEKTKKQEKPQKEKKDKKVDEMALLIEKNKELEEKLLRNQAEFVNFKRRKDEETSSLLKYSNMDIVRDVLPILDNFERAIDMDDDNPDDEVSKFLEGFIIIYNRFKETLSKYEVEEIEALGEQFDPNLHEAVMVEHEKDKESGIVLEVIKKGYKLKDRIIRPSMVKVNK